MKNIDILRLAALALALAALPSSLMAADKVRVGIAGSVKDDVQGILGEEAPQRIEVGEDVYFTERVITTTTSSAVFEFLDRSTLEVGPNASVVINRSVFNPVESVSEKTITVVAGAFRFMSGVAVDKSQTDFRTPVGTLGIRGSIVIGEVSGQGDTVLLPVEGVAGWQGGNKNFFVPQGGALVALHNGEPQAFDQLPPGFANVLRHIVSQVGVTPPRLQTFTGNQKSENAKQHVVSSFDQGQSQPDDGRYKPITPSGGQSDFGNVVSNALKNKDGGGNGQGEAAYIQNTLNIQFSQHHAHKGEGIVGVTQELYTVIPQDKLIDVGKKIAKDSPQEAAIVAAALVGLMPNRAKFIISEIQSVVPDEIITGSIDDLFGSDDYKFPPLPPLQRVELRLSPR